MTQELQDKVIVVTGGGSGIGRGTALAMAAEGARLVIADLFEDSAATVAGEIVANGGEAIALRCDVTQSAEVEQMFDAVIAHYGRVDCAFNNAGIEGRFARTVEYSDADWAQTLAVNLNGVFYCLRRELQEMLKNPSGGSIVNTASITGLVGWRGAPAYSASKHAVIGLTRTARERALPDPGECGVSRRGRNPDGRTSLCRDAGRKGAAGRTPPAGPSRPGLGSVECGDLAVLRSRLVHNGPCADGRRRLRGAMSAGHPPLRRAASFCVNLA